MKTYLVGGAVRDELLGLEPSERDWVVVGARPEDLLDAGYRQVGQDFPVFLHPETREEYALARTERKSGRGYRGFAIDANPGVTLEEDLQRRDLTINAMARGDDGELIDPWNGRADLDARRLRHVSPAFAEDPLRVLRVARFAARFAHLGFTVAEETVELMRRMAASGELETLVPERVWQETHRALSTRTPLRYFETLRSCGALDIVFPELSPLLEDTAGPAALQSATERTGDASIRFAAFTHPLDPDVALAELTRRLPIPKSWADLARLAARWHHLCLRACDAGATELAELFAACDALRRPARFEHLIEVCGAIGGEGAARSGDHLRQGLAAIAAIEAAPLVEAGWQGPDLGEELERRRLAALTRMQGGRSDGTGSE